MSSARTSNFLRGRRVSALAQRLKRWENLPLTTQVTFIFLVAMAMRLIYAMGVHSWEDHGIDEVIRVARSLAEGRGYESPFADDGTPSACIAPGYPTVLGGVYAIFGYGNAVSAGVQQGLTMLVVAAQFCLLPYLSRLLGLGSIPGFWAGFFGALCPFFLWVETRGWWEAPYAALLLVLCVIGIIRAVKDRPVSPTRSVAGVGLLVGVSLLTAPNLGPCLAVVLLICCLYSGEAKLGAFGRAIAIGLIALAAVAPWTWRNYEVFGSFVPVRSLFGLEFRMSHNPMAHAAFYDNLTNGVYDQLHPSQNAAQRDEILRLGEVEYGRKMLNEAQDWIQQRPDIFMRLTRARIYGFWFYEIKPVKRLIRIVVAPFVLAGLFLMLRRSVFAVIVLGSLLFVYPLLYYLIQTDARYFYPIYWCTLMCLGFGMAWLVDAMSAASAVTGQGPSSPSR